MRIDPKSFIADVPIMDVRRLLKANCDMTLDHIQRQLKINRKKAENLLSELQARELVEKVIQGADVFYQNTVKGNALAGASPFKPISRASAMKLLAKFLERADEVQRQPEFLFELEHLYLFGSMAEESDFVNDIDLAVSLKPKIKDESEHRAVCEAQRMTAIQGGKRFRNFFDRLFWPQVTVIKYLTSGTRRFSIHSVEELKHVNGKVIRIF